MAIQLNAEIRKVAGKGAARAVRNNKNIPAVVYGEKQEPVSIELDGHSFGLMIANQPGLRTKLFEIQIGDKQEDAMLIDIQYHPVTDLPLHADFKRIDVSKPVSVTVPVEVINAELSKGLKLGGVLNFAIRSIELIAPIKLVPEKVIIDLADLGVGETVHGSDLKLPTGVSLGLHQDDLTFAIIGGKMAEETDVVAAKSATATAAPAAGKAPAAAKAPAAKPAAKK